MSHKKVDKLIYNLSGEIKCELCNNTFISKLETPFKTIKLCKTCIEKNYHKLNNYVFNFSNNFCDKVNSPDIKGRQFQGDYLTWKQLKDYLNEIKNENILNLPVLVQEHHHFTYMKCNPIIDIRLDDELKWALEEKEFNGDEIRNKYELNLNLGEDDNEDYFLGNPKQFNLNLSD